jgi:hypothetical protein
MKADLRTIAADLLRTHKTVAAAAAELVTMMMADDKLQLAVATEFLRSLANTKSAPHVVRSRRRPGPHKSPKQPTAAQKAGALRAEKQYIASIFDHRLRGGQRLGQIRVHELRAIAEASASTATSFLTRGYEDAVEAIACTRMTQHCVAVDPFALVKDVIKATIAKDIFEQAKIDAAEVIRDGSAKLARDLIARAQKPEPPQVSQ